MDQPVAVVIIHGMGAQEPDYAKDIIDKLYKLVPKQLGDEQDAQLVVKAVYWADITHEKEEEVWQRVTASGEMDRLDLRRFIFNLAGDTLAYQPSEGRKELYLGVHRKIAETLGELSAEAGPEAPLCVVAHSLGTVVAQNYLYDLQHGSDKAEELPDAETSLERGETLSLLCTYGSPIAIWRLRFGDEYKAIDFPGGSTEEMYPSLQAKWYNIYDGDDVLGYPISQLTDHYEGLAKEGYLEDLTSDAGGLLMGWNPMSHKTYLHDDGELERLAGFIADIWHGANAEQPENIA